LRDLRNALFRYHGDSAVELTRALFLKTAREAEERGAFPLFVLTNWGPLCVRDANGATSFQRLLFDGLALHYVRVDLDPTWLDNTTYHPNTKAHAQLADAIQHALAEAGVVR
jgi:hypothetical protein